VKRPLFSCLHIAVSESTVNCQRCSRSVPVLRSLEIISWIFCACGGRL
jgi:hypothetical protein